MMLVENEELEEVDRSNPSSSPNDELMKSMLASNKRIQENIDQMQDQIKNWQLKDRRTDPT